MCARLEPRGVQAGVQHSHESGFRVRGFLGRMRMVLVCGSVLSIGGLASATLRIHSNTLRLLLCVDPPWMYLDGVWGQLLSISPIFEQFQQGPLQPSTLFHSVKKGPTGFQIMSSCPHHPIKFLILVLCKNSSLHAQLDPRQQSTSWFSIAGGHEPKISISVTVQTEGGS